MLDLGSFKEIEVKSLFLGERIDTRAIESTSVISTNPLLISVSEFSYAVIFKYGSVVLFNVSPLDEVSLIEKLKKFIIQPLDNPEVESVYLKSDKSAPESLHGNTIIIRNFQKERIQLIAEILAKNVVLYYYEHVVSANFDSIEPLATTLERDNKIPTRPKKLIKQIGSALLHLHKMVGRVEVTEKPELLWEHPELERLYARLEDEFELVERQTALERKIQLISRTVETVLNLAQTKQSLRVEWYIVILIIVEIIFTIYDLFLKSH